MSTTVPGCQAGSSPPQPFVSTTREQPAADGASEAFDASLERGMRAFEDALADDLARLEEVFVNMSQENAN